jgi:hypothetical protein
MLLARRETKWRRAMAQVHIPAALHAGSRSRIGQGVEFEAARPNRIARIADFTEAVLSLQRVCINRRGRTTGLRACGIKTGRHAVEYDHLAVAIDVDTRFET